MRIHNSLLLLAGLFLCVSCAQSRSVRTTIYEDRRTGVTLRKVVGHEAESLATVCSHPINFETEDMKYLLRSIHYREKGLFGWSDVVPVFSADELYRITPHFVDAFSRAAPDEHVLFRLTTAKQGALFSSERFTNGRMFVKDEELNCLFANINIRPDQEGIYDGNPVNNYAGVFWKLEPGNWQNLVEGKNGVHYNWVALDSERGLEEKRLRDQAARERAERRRAGKETQERRKVGWEDWEPDEAASIDQPHPEEDVYFPPSPSP